MGGGASTTVNLGDRARPVTPEFQLVVAGPDDLTTIPLPTGRDYLVGRGMGVHVRLNDEGASREHARLAIRDNGAEIEDLASGNGTFVAGKRIAPRTPIALRPGDAVGIGSTNLMLQRFSSTPQRRRVWSHVYFLGRLEEECFKAPELGACFALVRLRLPDGLADADADVGGLLSPALGPLDLVARYGARDWEILLPGKDRKGAEETLARIRGALGAEAAASRSAIAVYGVDGKDPAVLTAAAAAALHGSAVASGGGSTPLAATGAEMQNVFRLVERAATARSASASILVLGETGVGKSLLARWIHDRSPRSSELFHRIDLAAVTPTLVESELFGHKRGAFTGATADKAGLLEQANGGTLHLDEIGELSTDLQLKLLTSLQERQVKRVGETEARPIDVRVIASTNRDLRADMASGRFRTDLFYRLAVFVVVIPPLRQRVSEIEPLARGFLARYAAEEKLAAVPALSPQALDALVSYEWPGNIRELENAIRRAVVLCAGGIIQPEDLDLVGQIHDPGDGAASAEETVDLSDLDGEQLRERKKIKAVLDSHLWVVERAARAYGLGKTAFYKKLAKLKIGTKAGASPK
jgi:DNA-binding NtrC family response regulator